MAQTYRTLWLMLLTACSGAAQLVTAEPQETAQYTKLCKDAARDLITIIEAMRSTISGPIATITKKMNPTQRTEVTEWLSMRSMELMQNVEKIQRMQTPTSQQLISHANAVALTLDTLYDAVRGKFTSDTLVTITPEQVHEQLAQVLAATEEELSAELTRARTEAISDEMRAQLPHETTPELVRLVALGKYLAELQAGHANLTELLFDYGLTRTNQIARSIDRIGRKSIQQMVTPLSVLGFLAIGGGYAAYKLLLAEPKYRGEKQPVWATIMEGAIYHAGISAGGTLITKALKSGEWSWDEVKRQFDTWWKRMRGIKVKDKTIEGFDILKLEDCAYEMEPLIGLENQFARVMNSVQSALIRREQGEREPFKGIQRTFIFVGMSGTGKTFLADQLKLRIAELRERLGVDLAYEHIGPEQLLMTDLKWRIRAAQEKGLALILWIDEVHLLKPLKDGNPGVLWQLLQTEEIHKTNTPIWIFTATNEPGRFDLALTRAGRFEVINIYDLVRNERARMFDYYLREQGLILAQKELEYFATQTHKATPAQIRKVIDTARISGKALTRELIEQTIMHIIYKIVPGFESLSREEQQEVAIYQAGHALCHMLNELAKPEGRHKFMSGQRVMLVTAGAIEQQMKELAGMVFDAVAVNANYTAPRRIFGHVFKHHEREDFIESRTIAEKLQLIHELIAGAMAQEIILGPQNIADEMRTNDFKRAHELAKDITRAGCPFDLLSKKEQQRCLDQASELVRTAQKNVREQLTAHRTILETVAHTLLRNKKQPHLTAFDIMALIDKQGSTSSAGEQPTISTITA